MLHGNLLGLADGYVDVDIFFVISGYLITSIIIREIEKKQFSIIDFYERRARRILPALSVVLLATTAAAWLFMPAFLLESYAKSLVSVAVFCSNIFFYFTRGYFATASDEKPLLHTWSLAVEEQYYVFFPLLVTMLWFLGRKSLTYLIVVLSVLSLLTCQYLLAKGNIDANFYLIFSRAWELFAGSIIALTRLETRVDSLAARNVLSLLGLALAGMLVVEGIGVVLHGIPQRYHQSPYASTIQHSPKRDSGCHTGGLQYLKPGEACQYFGKRVNWVSFGDSHSVELAYALAKKLEDQGSGLVHLSFSGCPPALNFQAKQLGCSAWVNESLNYLEHKPEIQHVLLGFRYTKFLFGD